MLQSTFNFSRHTFWAAFSTGLGAVWHELGHCFGLGHTAFGIMNRGGDDVNLCLGFPAAVDQYLAESDREAGVDCSPCKGVSYGQASSGIHSAKGSNPPAVC